MPGGLFIQYDGKLIVGMYGPDGLLDRREVYSFERTGYYYVLNDSVDNGVLYSAESKERIGNDFVLLKSAGLFSLFKNLHTKELVLMNHNGAVLTMFSEEEA